MKQKDNLKYFNENGFLVLKDMFDIDFIDSLKKEINNLKDVEIYYDRNNNLRRIERLYNKDKNLKKLNDRILSVLKNFFHKDFIIFKDKFNSKPPGGEGFFAHYDGIFEWKKDNNDGLKRGWYEYSDFFINVLVALDECNHLNGALQISKIHNFNFEELLNMTNKDGSPNLKKEIEDNLIFEIPILNPGDIIIFSNKCPHRSYKNNSDKSRMTLYYTYHPINDGDNYDQYFIDKKNSKNKHKSLTGQS